jgi:hypothetical protein
MTEVSLYGPFSYRSTHNSESKLADDHTCVLCKQSIGIDRPYSFWFKDDSLKPKNMRYVHENCYQKWIEKNKS